MRVFVVSMVRSSLDPPEPERTDTESHLPLAIRIDCVGQRKRGVASFFLESWAEKGIGETNALLSSQPPIVSSGRHEPPSPSGRSRRASVRGRRRYVRCRERRRAVERRRLRERCSGHGRARASVGCRSQIAVAQGPRPPKRLATHVIIPHPRTIRRGRVALFARPPFLWTPGPGRRAYRAFLAHAGTGQSRVKAD